MRSGTVAGATVRESLERACARIRTSLADAPAYSAETPYLDALVLLGHVLGIGRERLLASMPDVLSRDQIDRYDELVAKRCSGLPVSYVTHRKEFYGRMFYVDERVLVPRPETELLVDCALDLIDREHTDRGGSPLHLHDACTGSGCVAITIAAERPRTTVTASDASTEALEVASRNANTLLSASGEADGVLFAAADVLPEAWNIGPPRIITANPPYLTDNEYDALARAHWPEPAGSLVAGKDGLALVRRLVGLAAATLQAGGWLVMEMGHAQGDSVAGLLSSAGYSDVEVRKDLAGHDRLALGRRW